MTNCEQETTTVKLRIIYCDWETETELWEQRDWDWEFRDRLTLTNWELRNWELNDWEKDTENGETDNKQIEDRRQRNEKLTLIAGDWKIEIERQKLREWELKKKKTENMKLRVDTKNETVTENEPLKTEDSPQTCRIFSLPNLS